MKRPGFGRSIAECLRRREAAFQADRPGAPPGARDEGSLEKRAHSQDLGPAPGVSGVLLYRQERFGVLQQSSRTAAVPLGPRGEIGDRAIHPGCQIVCPAELVCDTIGEPMPRFSAAHEAAPGQRPQRRLDVRQFRDARHVLRRERHTGQRGQRQQRPPLFSSIDTSNSAMRVAGVMLRAHPSTEIP